MNALHCHKEVSNHWSDEEMYLSSTDTDDTDSELHTSLDENKKNTNEEETRNRREKETRKDEAEVCHFYLLDAANNHKTDGKDKILKHITMKIK